MLIKQVFILRKKKWVFCFRYIIENKYYTKQLIYLNNIMFALKKMLPVEININEIAVKNKIYKTFLP